MEKREVKHWLIALLLGMFIVAGPAAGMGSKPPEPKAPAVKVPASELIDINSAKADQLMMLDGIGEARAKAIIKGRPYGRKDELAKRKIIPEATYERIKDRIIAKQR